MTDDTKNPPDDKTIAGDVDARALDPTRDQAGKDDRASDEGPQEDSPGAPAGGPPPFPPAG
jgi:hypothetical protein